MANEKFGACRSSHFELQSFIRCCPASFFDLPAGQKIKFQWQTFLSECYSKRIIIVKWPADTPAPGPGFVVKALKPAQLARIVVPYIKRKMGDLYDGTAKDDVASDQEKVDEDRPEWECHRWAEGEHAANLGTAPAS